MAEWRTFRNDTRDECASVFVRGQRPRESQSPISAVLAAAADDFRRGAVPGPTQRRMPENAKETRSSAAIRIIARKNLREDGSPKARRAAAPATSTAAAKPAQRQGPGCPTGPKRITADAVNKMAAVVSAVALAPIRCGSPRIPVATSSPRSGSTLARWAATPSNPPAVSAQAAGHRGGKADRVATAGSIPKAMAYGSQDRTVAFRPRL